MKVAIVGASGLIGRHLATALRARGDEVVAVSRSGSVAGGMAVRWDPAHEALPAAARDGVDAVVNLAGTPLTAGRWSTDTRRAILASRLDTTRGVADALGDGGPAVLVNSSAVGYYGPTEDAVDESAPAGDDFLATVCSAWEAAAMTASPRGRVVCTRTGIVLSPDGGAWPRLARVARLGVLGPLGSGRQWVPWIHVADEVAALCWCLDHDEVEGPANLVAPEAVRQAEFASAVRRAVHRPKAPPAPATLVRLALGESATLVLTGQRAVPSVLDKCGFAFGFPCLDGALVALVGGGRARP